MIARAGPRVRDETQSVLHAVATQASIRLIPQPISADLVGLAFDPIDVAWDDEDVMLYALGVGARPRTIFASCTRGPDRSSCRRTG